MTLPTDIELPLPADMHTANQNVNDPYLERLVRRLEDMYGDLAQNINGTIRDWQPTIYGLTSSGTGTYTRQVGWLRRAGIITEVWFDIAWSAHTGSGGAAILMPYISAASSGSPWIGLIESTSASNNFTAGFTYLTFRVEPSTTQGTIVANGSTVASKTLSLSGTGGFRGYIQYIGQENS